MMTLRRLSLLRARMKEPRSEGMTKKLLFKGESALTLFE
jgi:hypothetical protein